MIRKKCKISKNDKFMIEGKLIQAQDYRDFKNVRIYSFKSGLFLNKKYFVYEF